MDQTDRTRALVDKIKSAPITLSGSATSAQLGLIMHLTDEAGFDVYWEENPILYVLFGDERPQELSKANAARFIDHFGDKTKEGWKVKNLPDMSALHVEYMRMKGQTTLF